MSEKKLNILLITPEVSFGGADKSFSALSLGLSEKNNVFVVFFNQTEPPLYSLGGQIINLKTSSAHNALFSVSNFIKRWIKIWKLKKKFKIQVSISFLEGANYLNILTRHKDKIIISIRGSKEHDVNIKGLNGFIRKRILIPSIYKKADRIVCISEGIKRELTKKYNLDRRKIFINYNFIKTDEIEHLSNEKINPGDQKIFNYPVLISHNRLSYEKGLQFQLIILKELLVLNPEFKLILIGAGPFKSKLIELCEQLHLSYYEKGPENHNPEQYNVVFWGYTKNPFNLIKRSDIFLSTSFSEGFGNSIVEAMACKVPVLSTDCPYGPKEIIIPDFDYDSNNFPEYPIYHENGILLPIIKSKSDKLSIEIWTSTIINVLNNNALKINTENNAYNRAKYFNHEKNISTWLRIIDR